MLNHFIWNRITSFGYNWTDTHMTVDEIAFHLFFFFQVDTIDICVNWKWYGNKKLFHFIYWKERTSKFNKNTRIHCGFYYIIFFCMISELYIKMTAKQTMCKMKLTLHNIRTSIKRKRLIAIDTIVCVYKINLFHSKYIKILNW